MEQITEEMKVHEKWYEDAKNVTVESLPDFIKRLTEDYQHDYGTICHAIAAGAMAAIHAIDSSPQGGMTGFQAGCVMWQIVTKMNYNSNKCGLRIIDYDNYLYPQHLDDGRKISESTWTELQKEAKNSLLDLQNKQKKYDEETYPAFVKALAEFREKVVDFQKLHPEYPKYDEQPDFYNRLRCGTSEEWDKEHAKEKTGFLFAPEEPYKPSVHPNVLEHWKSMANGCLPEGLILED